MVQYRRDKKKKWIVQVADRFGKMKTTSFLSEKRAKEYELLAQTRRDLQRVGLKAPRLKSNFYERARIYIRNRYQTHPASTVSGEDTKFRNHWIPLFRHIPVDQITTAEILEELDRIQYELKRSPATRNRHRALLHSFFQDLFMRDLVDVNPVAKIPLVEEKQVRKTRKIALTPEEQEQYVRLLGEEGPQYDILGHLLRWTGARVCSCNVIQYQDIDFEKNIIAIRRLEERVTHTVRLRQKKGEGGETILPLFPALRIALLNHRARSHYSKPSDYVASGPMGKYVPYDTFKDVHRRAVEKMQKEFKTEKFTPHDLRRAFATNAKRAGFTRTEIREMLDQSSDQIVERYDLKDVEHLAEKGRRLGFGVIAAKGNIIPIRGKK